jgi:hypothetical protein
MLLVVEKVVYILRQSARAERAGSELGLCFHSGSEVALLLSPRQQLRCRPWFRLVGHGLLWT